MSATLPTMLQVLATAAVLVGVGMNAQLRVGSLVNACAVQSLLVACIALGQAWSTGSWMMALMGGALVLVRGLVIPSNLREVMRHARLPLRTDTAPTLSLPVATPISQKNTTRRISASARLTAGPAEITAMRFHTGWAW